LKLKQRTNKILGRLFTRHPVLVKLWASHTTVVEFPDTPWTPLAKAAKRCRLALVTTGGVHLEVQRPFDMMDPDGDPTFREIPAHTSPRDLRITHDYYDHTDADRDINVVFPLERVRELETLGEIGAVNPRHFSFMGHIKNAHIATLLNDTAPGVASALKSDGVDIAILTPA
jgi:D-proline reductase (dithiol) PrdB